MHSYEQVKLYDKTKPIKNHPYEQEGQSPFLPSSTFLARDDHFICIARKIAMARRIRGFSQKDFAKHIGISLSYLAKIESAKSIEGMSLDMLYLIAKGLSLQPYELLAHNDDDCQYAQHFMTKRLRRKRVPLPS